MSKKDLSQKEQEVLIQELNDIISELGWVIGMPDTDEAIPGLIIGMQDFVEDVVNVYYGPNYSTLEEGADGSLVEVPSSKKETLH